MLTKYQRSVLWDINWHRGRGWTLWSWYKPGKTLLSLKKKGLIEVRYDYIACEGSRCTDVRLTKKGIKLVDKLFY